MAMQQLFTFSEILSELWFRLNATHSDHFKVPCWRSHYSFLSLLLSCVHLRLVGLVQYLCIHSCSMQLLIFLSSKKPTLYCPHCTIWHTDIVNTVDPRSCRLVATGLVEDSWNAVAKTLQYYSFDNNDLDEWESPQTWTQWSMKQLQSMLFIETKTEWIWRDLSIEPVCYTTLTYEW